MKKITLLFALSLASWTAAGAQNDNLIKGGDFDRANWQNYDLPDLWSFDDLGVKLIETASYPGNKGWMYIDVTPQVGGKMRLYRENDDMKMEYGCFNAKEAAKYEITFWAKSDTKNTIQINLPWHVTESKLNGNWTSPEIELEGGTWKKYTVYTDVAPAGTTTGGLEVWFATANGVISFDDFSVSTDTENHPAGEVLVDGKKVGGAQNDYTQNLVKGGDFDRANWQDYDMPDLWTFNQLDVKLIETPSYPGNKGWMYIDVKPTEGGSMSLYRENDDMKKEYHCIDNTTPAKYAITFWAKNTGSSHVRINLPWYNGSTKTGKAWTSPAIKIEGEEWKQYCVFTEAAPEGATGAGLEVWFDDVNGTISFDDFGVFTDVENHTPGEIVIDGKQEQNPDGDKEEQNENLFEFGGFEEINPLNKKPMGWYMPNSAYFSFSNDIPSESTGKQSLRVYPEPSVRIMTNVDGKENILKVEENKTYTVEFWAKGMSDKDRFSARFSWYGNDELVGTPTYIAEEEAFAQEWTKHSYEVTVPWDVNSASFAITFSTDVDFAFFDDLRMTLKKESTGIRSEKTTDVHCFVEGGQLTVSTPVATALQVYDLSGKQVAAAAAATSHQVTLQKGAYIVKAGDAVRKVMVK